MLLISLAFAAPLDSETAQAPGDAYVAGPAGIVNGETEDGFPATVALGAGGFSMCTGSMITPRIVLSAAHCGEEIPLEVVVSLGSAYFGTEATNADDERKFADMAIHPDYVPLANGFNGTRGEFDMAVLVLEEDAPVDPVWFNERDLSEDDVAGTEIISVGFGVTGSSGAGGGTKRSATLTVDDVDEMFVLSRSSTNEGNANICSGDSGGPQYYFDDETGLWEQWAVHSWGDQNCLFESGSTRTDIARDWLYEQIEKVHGTTDRCAINNHYGDGVCDSFCANVDEDCIDVPSGFASLDAASTGEEPSSGACATSPAAAGFLPMLLGLLALRRR